jgi:hypothetical protein
MKADCIGCGAEFDAETAPWARHRLTGLEAEGYNGTNWYGRDGDWPASDAIEYEVQVGGVGTFGRCPECVDRIHDADERSREYCSDVAPEWFDPDYAGERWDDMY